MELSSEHVISQCIARAHKGCKRNIRDDLTINEKNVLQTVKSLMEVINTSHCHVFCIGNYVSFLEGVLNGYTSITIVYTCEKSHWYEILDPQTNLEIFMNGRGNILNLKEEVRLLNDGNKFERNRCKLEFTDETKFIIDIGKVTIFHSELERNIMKFFTYIKTNTYKVALPYERDIIFRGEKVEPQNNLRCYGSPFSLSWCCARKLRLI